MLTKAIDIPIQKTERSRIQDVDFNNLQFGKVFSDHMFVMDYCNGEWQQPSIQPYQELKLTPATSMLHYGQGIFEGLKAHPGPNGEVYFFRPEENIKRMNASAERMCMPQIPEDLFMDAMRQLVDLDQDWIPDDPESSLYIRPVMFGMDDFIGVAPAQTYKFLIITGPVAGYYSKPVNVKVETKYSRACPGGVGAAKAAANYAMSLYPAQKAREEGYDQLIWTDAKEHRYIEESGTMNVMFLINDELITAPLSDTILPGVTRKSVLEVAREWGVKVSERKLSVEELQEAIDRGSLQDAFGTGTAATIAHIRSIGYQGQSYELPPVEERELSNQLKDHLEKLKRGQIEDERGWLKKL